MRYGLVREVRVDAFGTEWDGALRGGAEVVELLCGVVVAVDAHRISSVTIKNCKMCEDTII